MTNSEETQSIAASSQPEEASLFGRLRSGLSKTRKQLAQGLGNLLLGEKEINYLVTYSKRNISDLINIINKLDKTSMQLKRKITIPLIKEVI